MRTVDEEIEELKRGTDEILVEGEFVAKIKKSRETKKPLEIKVGFDPTAPDLHLGHTVVIQKMAQFQRYGHNVTFLIGDFTGLVGDPSGKSKTRPQLTRDEVVKNAETYKTQVYKILDPKKTSIRFNSEWLDKLTAYDFVRLASHANVARMLEREDFNKRYKGGESISLHEFMYPLLQAYDSVCLKADVEMGGRDQKFNLLLGRELMKDFGLESQVCLTMPLLEGTDGVQKMSKSLGNYVGVTESPEQIYGKIMSIPDSLLRRYFELLSAKTIPEINALLSELEKGARHPKEVKSEIACEIVERFHDKAAAGAAKEHFEKVHSRKELPDDMPEVNVPFTPEETWLPKLLVDVKFVTTTSEGKRMVQQGAVKIDQKPVTQEKLKFAKGDSFTLQCGKRKFAKITIS